MNSKDSKDNMVRGGKTNKSGNPAGCVTMVNLVYTLYVEVSGVEVTKGVMGKTRHLLVEKVHLNPLLSRDSEQGV